MWRRKYTKHALNDSALPSLVYQLQHENDRLRRSVSELSLLNELAVEISSAQELEAVMAAVIRRARNAVQASQAEISLIERTDREYLRKTLVRTTSGSYGYGELRPNGEIVQWMRSHKAPLVVHAGDTRSDLLAIDPSIRSLVSVPMIASARLEGMLSVYNRLENTRFSAEDVRLLSIIAAQSAQALQTKRIDGERRQIQEMFGLHTAPEVVEEVLLRPEHLAGVRRRACIMFVDIRGFSRYAEKEEPENVVTFLNSFFDLTLEAVTNHHGIVHQLLGDGFMALFGVPISRGNPTLNAVNASLEIIARLEGPLGEAPLQNVQVGIGLHTGDVIAGLVGSSRHQEYKVTGDAVNVAARIEGLNKEYGSRVLASGAVAEEVQLERFSPTLIGNVVLRGRRTPTDIYKLA